MKPFKFLLLLIFAASLSTGCNDPAKENRQYKRRIFDYASVQIKSTLQKVSELNVYMDLPDSMHSHLSIGHDFDVFYFSPKDSIHENFINAGVYFGHWPQLFGPRGDSCTFFATKGSILNEPVWWRIYHCDGTLFMETKMYANELGTIHAFGRPNNEEGIKKLLKTFSTLRKSEASYQPYYDEGF